jgi:hypothetical protein
MKGKLKKRGMPTREEVESKDVTEVNHEEWINMLCQETVVEDTVCCQQCQEWVRESCTQYC